MCNVKDTINEFQTYRNNAEMNIIPSSETINNLGVSDDSDHRNLNEVVESLDEENDEHDDSQQLEEEEEEEEEDEEDQYDAADLAVVKHCIALMHLTLESLQAGLSIMTIVADADAANKISNPINMVENTMESLNINGELSTLKSSATECNSTSLTSATFASGETTLREFDSEITNLHFTGCDYWVSIVSKSCASLESHLTDFGAAMYPPLDEDSLNQLKIQGNLLKDSIFLHFDILRRYPNRGISIDVDVLATIRDLTKKIDHVEFEFELLKQPV